MRRRILWIALAVGGCSAAEPLPGTVADCDAELQAVQGQIEARKTELTAAEALLRKTSEDRQRLAGEPDSDTKAARMDELGTAEAELGERIEGLRAEVGRLEERIRELTARRQELAAAEAEAARAKAEEEARARAEAEAEAKRKSEEEARAREEEARRKAEAEAESRRKSEEEARLRAEEAARRKAEEEARRKAEEEARIRAEAEAQRKLEEEKRQKAEALGRAETLVVDGVALFRQVQEAMKTPPQDPEAVRGLLEKIEKALATLEQARAANAALRGESADPVRIDDRLKKIDLLIGILRGHREALKK